MEEDERPHRNQTRDGQEPARVTTRDCECSRRRSVAHRLKWIDDDIRLPIFYLPPDYEIPLWLLLILTIPNHLPYHQLSLHLSPIQQPPPSPPRPRVHLLPPSTPRLLCTLAPLAPGVSRSALVMPPDDHDPRRRPPSPSPSITHHKATTRTLLAFHPRNSTRRHPAPRSRPRHPFHLGPP